MNLPDGGYIETIGKDNKIYRFVYSVRTYIDKASKLQKNVFMVFRENMVNRDPFDFQFVELPGKVIKITDMFVDYGGHCKGKGLPEALICEVNRLFPDYNISSSSNTHKALLGEWRSTQGSAVWERLVRIGKAKYLSDYDTYMFIRT